MEVVMTFVSGDEIIARLLVNIFVWYFLLTSNKLLV